MNLLKRIEKLEQRTQAVDFDLAAVILAARAAHRRGDAPLRPTEAELRATAAAASPRSMALAVARAQLRVKLWRDE
jgi:hypothetical protein